MYHAYQYVVVLSIGVLWILLNFNTAACFSFNEKDDEEKELISDLFPEEIGMFERYEKSYGNPMRFTARYRLPRGQQRVSVTLIRSELGRQHYQNNRCEWDEQSAAEIGGEMFYGVGDLSESRVRNRSTMNVDGRIDDFTVNITFSDHGDDPDEEEVEQLLTQFIEDFETERLYEWEAPEKKAPPMVLEVEAFEDFVPQKTEQFTLQDISTANDAMHLKAEYLYEPEDHKVILHIAYGEDSRRLLRSHRKGQFRAAVETRCLEQKIESVQEYREHRDRLRESVSEADLTAWDLEHGMIDELNPLVQFFPAETDQFSVASLRPNDEELEVRGFYDHEGHDDEISIAVTYGDNAATEYRRLQLALSESDYGRKELGAKKVDFMYTNGNVAAHIFHDDLLYAIGYRNPDEEDPEVLQKNLISFMQEFSPDSFADFEPSTDHTVEYAKEDKGTRICYDLDCVTEQVASCESAKLGDRISRRQGMTFSVEEATGNDQCRISLVYTRHPESDWEDQPLYFTLNQGDDFRELAPRVLNTCLEGGGSDEFACEGPLLDVIEEE